MYANIYIYIYMHIFKHYIIIHIYKEIRYIYIYIYIYIHIFIYISQKQRSFRGPGGVYGLGLRHWAQICARKLASVASKGSPVASRLVNTKIQNSKLGRGSGQILNFYNIDSYRCFDALPKTDN